MEMEETILTYTFIDAGSLKIYFEICAALQCLVLLYIIGPII